MHVTKCKILLFVMHSSTKCARFLDRCMLDGQMHVWWMNVCLNVHAWWIGACLMDTCKLGGLVNA